MYRAENKKKKIVTEMENKFKSQVKPSQNRYSFGRDYKLPGMYFITIRKSSTTPLLSQLRQMADGPIIADPTAVGRIVVEQLSRLESEHPFLHVSKQIIMPDHVHFLLWVKEPLPDHLGRYIAKFKTYCTQALRTRYPELRETSFFETGAANNRLVFREGQLEKVKRYCIDNPRRLWIKQRNPDLFTRVGSLTIDGAEFKAVGNRFLLDHYDIEAVRISSHFMGDELGRRLALWDETIALGGVLVGGFISREERAIRDKAIAAGGRLILLMDHPMPERYKPSGKWFDYCASGRLLIIAPAEPFPREYSQRRIFLYLNDIAESIAAGRFTRG